jgi:hypothetical protein
MSNAANHSTTGYKYLSGNKTHDVALILLLLIFAVLQAIVLGADDWS